MIMSYKLVFLPPVRDRHRAWAENVRSEVKDIDIVLAETRDQALTELRDARAAFGTLDTELLAAAPGLEWLAAPAAGPRPEFYFPELVASDVIVTNQRGIYNDIADDDALAMICDIGTVRAIADDVVVMFQGKVVESGPKAEMFVPPHHEYTDLLLASVPEMDPDWLENLLEKRALGSNGIQPGGS